LAIYLFSKFGDPAIMTLLGMLMGIELLFNGMGLIVLGFSVKSDEAST